MFDSLAYYELVEEFGIQCRHFMGMNSHVTFLIEDAD